MDHLQIDTFTTHPPKWMLCLFHFHMETVKNNIPIPTCQDHRVPHPCCLASLWDPWLKGSLGAKVERKDLNPWLVNLPPLTYRPSKKQGFTSRPYSGKPPANKPLTRVCFWVNVDSGPISHPAMLVYRSVAMVNFVGDLWLFRGRSEHYPPWN